MDKKPLALLNRVTISSVFAIVLLAISVIAVLLPLGKISFYFAILPQFLLIALMMQTTNRAYQSLVETGTPEQKVWFFFLAGTLATFVGEMLYLVGNIANPVNMIIIFSSTVFMLGAYVFFIIGLWRVSFHIRTAKGGKPNYIPAIITFVVIAFIGAVLFVQMQKANTAGVLMVTFLGYLIPDFFIIAISATVMVRTWGGMLFSTYIMYAVGCLFLVTYQISASFLVLGGVPVHSNPIQLLFMVALVSFVVGSDMRYKTEMRLREVA
jgi:hypothetical protein